MQIHLAPSAGPDAWVSRRKLPTKTACQKNPTNATIFLSLKVFHTTIVVLHTESATSYTVVTSLPECIIKSRTRYKQDHGSKCLQPSFMCVSSVLVHSGGNLVQQTSSGASSDRPMMMDAYTTIQDLQPVRLAAPLSCSREPYANTSLP